MEKVKKIYVKSLFSGWHEVSEGQAAKWARTLIEGANCGRKKIIEIVRNRISGATLSRLGIDEGGSN